MAALHGEATVAGLGSLLSFQLFVTGDNLGALNLYARRPHAFGEESESVGLVFASHRPSRWPVPRTSRTCARR